MAFCFFLSERALLLQAKINAITLKVTITLTRPVRELNYYTHIASRELFPIPAGEGILSMAQQPAGVSRDVTMAGPSRTGALPNIVVAVVNYLAALSPARIRGAKNKNDVV